MKKKKVEKEFVGTRDLACAVFFEDLALSSKDNSECKKYYESLADEYRKKVNNTNRKFRVTISRVN
jgi:hypothetical protein